MSGVNRPFRATPCARIGGAIRGGLFCGFATLGGAAISIARGEFVGAALVDTMAALKGVTQPG